MTALDLAALRADVLSILARLDALEGAGTIAIDECDVLEVPEACRIARKSDSQVRKLAAKHRLGKKLGNRWLLSRSRFVAFVEGAR